MMKATFLFRVNTEDLPKLEFLEDDEDGKIG